MRVIKVWRIFGLKGVFKGIYYKLGIKGVSIIRSTNLPISFLWEETYVVEDNSQVVLYTNEHSLFPDYWPRRSLQEKHTRLRVPVTVISTCKNEEGNAAQWLSSLSQQTLPPDEIIIVDGGSNDRTVEILKKAATQHNLVLKILEESGANIAVARNLAIRNASFSLIASLDFGCIPHNDWLEKLIRPFEIEPQIEVSAGWYQALEENGKNSRFRGVPSLKDVTPQRFIPSSRSLVFTKQAWEKAGGYPEWLTLTGEDTYFALELKRYCSNWAFVPDAIVNWKAPNTWPQMWKKAVYWATGDGEIGYNTPAYRYNLRRLLTAVLVFGLAFVLTACFLFWFAMQGWWLNFVLLAGGWFIFTGILIASSWIKERDPFFIFGMLGLYLSQIIGFWRGAQRRQQVSLRRLSQTKGLFFLLAGVPIDDTGGGARSSQLALELLRQNFWVVYINRFPKHESQDVNIQIGHPNLLTFELQNFDWNLFARQFETLFHTLDKYVIVEFPVVEFLPLIMMIKEVGGKVAYEIIDDWDSSLGGSWYTQELERRFIEESNLLIATAPILKKKIEKISGQTVKLLPNAVNGRLFDPDRIYHRPDDLPHAEWIMAYIGALWGDWFDWDLLRAIALRYPGAAVVAIGDYRDQCANPPDNLRFLGLKPQSALPSYLAHIDVALIPWKVNAITQATSPLKLYEYLAMRRPVVAPDLNPLRDIPGVHLAKDFDDFVRLVNEVQKGNPPVADMDDFVAKNNWQARILQLLEWLAIKN